MCYLRFNKKCVREHMAIAAVDLFIFKKLKAAGVLPAHPSVLELGEAEWYGDASTETLCEDIDALIEDPDKREALHQQLVNTLAVNSPQQGWDIAKVFYRVFLDYSKISAIDLHGTPAAQKLDLNQPVDLGEQFDVVINNGTAEHVFNVYQLFRSVHEMTRPGGKRLVLIDGMKLKSNTIEPILVVVCRPPAK